MTHGKVLFVIAHTGYQPVEYAEPKKIVEEAGYSVVTASNKSGIATDKDGGSTKIDLALGDVQTKEYDGVFFIGGPGALEHLDNEQSYSVIQKTQQQNKPIGAICIATRILAHANALTRKHATGYNGDHELEKIYATYDIHYMPDPVVVDENVVTAVGPTAAREFGQEIVSLLHDNKGWG